MASRRRIQRRQPRAHQRAEKCISIMPDGTTEFFTPQPKEPHTKLVKDKRGRWIVATKERALR